jgi:transposase-like protein
MLIECPYCKKTNKHIIISNFYNLLKFQCVNCKKNFLLEGKEYKIAEKEEK